MCDLLLSQRVAGRLYEGVFRCIPRGGRGLLTPESKPVHGNVAWPPIRVQEQSVSLLNVLLLKAKQEADKRKNTTFETNLKDAAQSNDVLSAIRRSKVTA